ncbi:cation/H+ exchanger protein 1 [Engraulis encrasicolus]|uniref:cation/H+ exchanger protein 1 n=1 Tax=Engraulis encrasicolus TaxID=184585 RepID=UPI002FD48946
MSHCKSSASVDGGGRRRRPSTTAETSELHWEPESGKANCHNSTCDRLGLPAHHPDMPETPSPCFSHPFGQRTAKRLSNFRGFSQHSLTADGWQEGSLRTTICAENDVEAHKEVNNHHFGFRKWKSHVTEQPFEERTEEVKELYSDLNFIRPVTGSSITPGNIIYLVLFGWWVSLAYFLICGLMFSSIIGIPYGRLCHKLSCYFLWPFGKAIQKTNGMAKKCCAKVPDCEAIPEEDPSESSSTEVAEHPPSPMAPTLKRPRYWCRISTYVWLLLGFPLLAVVHCLASLLAWVLVFYIPVAKMNARTLRNVLLLPPEEVHIRKLEKQSCETEVLLCCYSAFNRNYYKYKVDGINVFAVNLLPFVFVTILIGYLDREGVYVSAQAKFAMAVSSIIPLSYYIGMGIASISAQSNFAVGAVVNATFGSITEMTFYITALLEGYRAGNKCYEEIVKAALTGTLMGCILFIPGICMIIGGLKHREQRFNSRSAGVSSALLFISVGGVFAPTLFSKAYGKLVCEACSVAPGNMTASFSCRNCHYDLTENNWSLFHSHIEPLVYTVSVLLPAAYIIGLIFTLKTHSHIYDIHINDDHGQGHEPVVLWSRLRALVVLIMTTLMMAACADLTTENIRPIISHSSISQYFIGVTVLAMVPELPEIVNGIQFALQNNISLSLEVGSCIAVQVCMIQIPLLILFNAFYDVGFVLIFSDLHLWASIFSVILVNYIFMDGKSDYFQGTALVVVYLILLALYFFAPSPAGC